MSGSRSPRDCRVVRERMTLRYYGALRPGEVAADAAHVESCPDCAREWKTIGRVLDGIDPRAVFPDEDRVDWDRFARRTVDRARAAELAGVRTGSFFPVPLRWALLAAVLVLGALGLIVRLRQEKAGPAVAGLLESAHVMERRLAQQGAVRYLSDSRSLLLNIVGATVPCRRTDGRYDITLEKEKSRQLLRRKNLYEGDLGDLQDRRLATLVRQLESVLMQVAALDDCASVRQLHDLREEIETRQILLRIDLLTRQMAGRTDVV